MTVWVGHVYREEGTFLPSAIIESRAHQIHATLDKRINVFHSLAAPVINVTKVVDELAQWSFAQLEVVYERRICHVLRACMMF